MKQYQYKDFTYFLIRFGGDKVWVLKRNGETVGRYGSMRHVKAAIAEME